jgi:hypothetical protein
MAKKLVSGGFEGVGHFKEFGDGVPVAGGAGGVKSFVEIGPIKSGFASADGEVDVELATDKMQLFGIDFELEKGIGGFARGLVREEGDQKFAGFDAGTSGKGILGNYATEIGGSAEDHRRAKPELALDGGLDCFGKLRKILLLGLENDIAALDVGLRASEFERGTEGAEGVHFDLVVAANIDATEQADDRGHGKTGYYKSAGRMPFDKLGTSRRYNDRQRLEDSGCRYKVAELCREMLRLPGLRTQAQAGEA